MTAAEVVPVVPERPRHVLDEPAVLVDVADQLVQAVELRAVDEEREWQQAQRRPLRHQRAVGFGEGPDGGGRGLGEVVEVVGVGREVLAQNVSSPPVAA